MLVTSFFYFLSYFFLFFTIICFFNLFFKKNLFVFTKIWIVFVYFLLLNLLLALFGEDFFIVFALAAELPVFFGFFFFCIVKTQLQNQNEITQTKNNRVKVIVLLILLTSINFLPERLSTNNFFNFYSIFLLPQRSDFYIFYFTYFFINPQLVIFVGLLISVVTVLLILLTFCFHILSIKQKNTKKNISWVKTQNVNKQTSFTSKALFFKL